MCKMSIDERIIFDKKLGLLSQRPHMKSFSFPVIDIWNQFII